MKRKRGFSTYLYLFMRKIGLLSHKKYPNEKLTIKIQKSVYFDGSEINHDDFMLAKNLLPKNYKGGKNKKTCQYDFRSHTCRCGINLQELKNGKKCSI